MFLRADLVTKIQSNYAEPSHEVVTSRPRALHPGGERYCGGSARGHVEAEVPEQTVGAAAAAPLHRDGGAGEGGAEAHWFPVYYLETQRQLFFYVFVS